jgi:hypothetical protein
MVKIAGICCQTKQALNEMKTARLPTDTYRSRFLMAVPIDGVT